MGFITFSEPDVVALLQEVINQFKDKWSKRILSLSVFFDKLAIAGTLIRLYRKYGDDPRFRDTIEAFYIRLIENKGFSPQQIVDMLGIKFMPDDVQEMVIEDLEEAVETLKLKKFLKENEAKVYKFLTQASASES